jgi:hypothetical protein
MRERMREPPTYQYARCIHLMHVRTCLPLRSTSVDVRILQEEEEEKMHPRSGTELDRDLQPFANVFRYLRFRYLWVNVVYAPPVRILRLL